MLSIDLWCVCVYFVYVNVASSRPTCAHVLPSLDVCQPLLFLVTMILFVPLNVKESALEDKRKQLEEFKGFSVVCFLQI